ncbi:MAG: hypothetical protein ACJ8F7_10015 [Gemmataceae bacterium]
MLHDLASAWLRRIGGAPCFRIYGKAKSEAGWRTIDVFATHRRDRLSPWPLWRGTCITWTDSVMAVGWDFAEALILEQTQFPASREHPVEVAGGRLRHAERRRAAGGGDNISAAEVMAHECGHTLQARRLGALYWIVGAALTRYREGERWRNWFENQASETGQFGGFVPGSVCGELMRRLDNSSEPGTR